MAATGETGTKDYTTYSYWLETCGDDLTPRPRLDGPTEADIAILGAGYSGLWTAYYLLQRDPSLRVVLIEKEIAGFGASGRNGGWCYAGFPLTLGGMEERYGAEGAAAVQQAMIDTIAEIERVCTTEGIDCDFRKDGYIRLARGRHEAPIIKASYETIERLGFGECYQLLSKEEAEEHVLATDIHGALRGSEAASIHPGKLVRGLAHAVERHGATIYEQTEVTDYRTGKQPALITPYGEVRARAIVLAGEAYLSKLKKLHRQVIPVYSLIALTEPLTPEQDDVINWHTRELVASNRYTVDYLNRTADRRLLFGSRGAPYHWGSSIEDSYDRHEETHEMIKRLVVEWFPPLQDVRFTHTWGGPVGMPRDFHPAFRYDKADGVATARAYTGTGVGTTNLAGRILADLLQDERTPVTELPIVGHRSRNWEPEPFRWLGVRYMQESFEQLDERARRSGEPPRGTSFAERMTAH